MTLTVRDRTISTYALLDSGAAGDFISYEFVKLHNFTLSPCTPPLAVEAVDGRPLGKGRITQITEEINLNIGVLHNESIRFYVIQSPHNPLILGLPWLRRHDPQISWKDEQILQ